MTDLEMTKLCAEAMGLDYVVRDGAVYVTNGIVYYDPLNHDSHAMALVKKLELEITRQHGLDENADDIVVWDVAWYAETQGYAVEDVDLNRAIVECVAKMEQNRLSQKKKTVSG